MRKKEIEKVPYLKLKKTSRKKGVKYIGVTAVKIIGHKKHLFLEIYKNKNGEKEIPVVRLVLSQKDFGTYIPEQDEWTRKTLRNEYYDADPIWETAGDGEENRGRDAAVKRNILQDTGDLERLKKFTKQKIFDERRWWEYAYQMQKKIKNQENADRWIRKHERRQQALKERCDNTPPLPEKEILKMADTRIFHGRHFLYYKRRGSFAEVCCSKCGGVDEYRWRQGETYESTMQKWIDKPEERKIGTCPMCGAMGIWKPQGKVNRGNKEKAYVFLGNRYKETGMVIRYVELYKEWQLEEIPTLKGAHMLGACEILEGIEIARGYLEPGKKLQIDYKKHSWYTGKDFWDDCNMHGMSNIIIHEAPVMDQTYEELEGTIFQYSGLKEYVAAVRETNPIDYLERYQQTPQIEMLVKMRLYPIVKELVSCHYGIVRDEAAKRLDEFLGIRKDKVKYLIRKEGEIEILYVLQEESRLGQNWTEEQIEKLAEIRAGDRDFRVILNYMTVQKILNAIEKYAGCSYGTGCSHARDRLMHAARIYFDYIAMRIQLGYDMRNTVYQRPRDLKAAHDKMMLEIDKAKIDRRMKEVEEKFPLIKKNYKKLRKKYLYKDESYIIRPARSAEEIVMEGRMLHHCVGGDSYLRSHNDGDSTILMLRFADKPEKPYITVEIKGERILQWYGAHDKKPDEKNMRKWIDMYITRLKCQMTGTAETAEEQTMQTLMEGA